MPKELEKAPGLLLWRGFVEDPDEFFSQTWSIADAVSEGTSSAKMEADAAKAEAESRLADEVKEAAQPDEKPEEAPKSMADAEKETPSDDA